MNEKAYGNCSTESTCNVTVSSVNEVVAHPERSNVGIIGPTNYENVGDSTQPGNWVSLTTILDGLSLGKGETKQKSKVMNSRTERE